MNIFVLDTDPGTAAEYHCDKHVIKMILESAQMLCTVCNQHDRQTPYLSAHPKHPCTLWAGNSLSNWLWLKELAKWLNNEYLWRYDKAPHKSWEVIEKLEVPPIEDIGLTQFPLCMPDKYKSDNVVQSYREFYRKEKARFATWSFPAKEPRWFRRKT